MKNLKKLNRENLKRVNGGAGNFCNFCEIHETCGSGCNGESICIPKGEHFPPNC
ncbi:bacteriocin-like protein [Chryseobacterium oncorhynchi]|uniref:bacteriocin-like protein n=1 Tax=Chryseobacterium TaxID=59732 RepID=UPI00267BA75F